MQSQTIFGEIIGGDVPDWSSGKVLICEVIKPSNEIKPSKDLYQLETISLKVPRDLLNKADERGIDLNELLKFALETELADLIDEEYIY